MSDILARHSLDLLHAELSRWLRTNLAAQQFQRSLPAESMPNLDDWHVIVPSMALLAPDRLRTAEAIIRSAVLTVDGMVDGSLSHPVATVDVRTDAESGATVSGEGDEVQELRDEVARLRQVITNHLAACPEVPRADAASPGRAPRWLAARRSRP